MERLMKNGCGSIFIIALMSMTTLAVGQNTQNTVQTTSTAAEPTTPMVLTVAVPLEGVKGRFDHFAAGKGKVFVSAIGNDAVEVIDMFKQTRVHEVTGVPNPQGVAFSPETNKLFAASEKGKVYIYDGDSFNLLAALDFEGGADNLRYDAATKRVYVGCGDDDKNSAIAAIDAVTNKRLDEVYKLGGEPESFQLEKSGPNIYVNVPDLKQIVVINRTTRELKRWPITQGQNFPMALDETNHRLIVGTREPPVLSILDTNTGRVVATLPTVQDTDDLYYSAEHKRIYVPGREGSIWIYQQSDPDHYSLIAKVPTVVGAGTAGYFGKQTKGFDRFYLAVPATGSSTAEVRVYTVRD
jgi:DNA-binding beta-propeller fold protein YncE